jgi:hypothetical protein
VGKTICEKTSLLPRSCAVSPHVPVLGVSLTCVAVRYWEWLSVEAKGRTIRRSSPGRSTIDLAPGQEPQRTPLPA